ncbi:unnamed protein product [Soboliphyme baturini]|uniref:CWF19-like protein 1 homolog n=1 Tax=Soboliphyme baturini TaxID=241478 RepID=A0A183IRZ2_9BILA|nr:unnamed protein product [Soboliphyme baturini]
MTSSNEVKVLVCGDVDGQFETLWVRLEQALKKVGFFEMMFVCGEFFGANHNENQRIFRGELRCPLPTYILGPIKPDRKRYYCNVAGELLSHNLTFLGEKGIFYTASGLSVAYLSGTEGEYMDICHYSREVVDELIASITCQPDFVGVDILLTRLISKLVGALKPRYHFAANTGCHYERPPYRNHNPQQEGAQHTSRFVGLARVGNPQKLKYLYAFHIVPMRYLSRTRLTEQPPNATEFPYTEAIQEVEQQAVLKQSAKDEKLSSIMQLLPKLDASDVSTTVPEQDLSRKSRKRHHKKEPDYLHKHALPGPCWFCLSSPEVEKHMIVSIGENAYLALAKGGLCEDHFLILPIAHVQSMVTANEEVKEEVEKYKEALKRCFSDKGQCVVFFERNYRTQHLQIQAVPLPMELIHAIKPCFTQTAQKYDIQLTELPDNVTFSDLVNEKTPYFTAELPYGQRLFTTVDKNFPLQFGREVLASAQLLNLPDKVDWHNCKLTTVEETQLALKFRQCFCKYDFNDC